MKRLLVIVVALLVIACSGGSSFKDGRYFAEEADFAPNGWKGNVELEVSGGKIIKAEWNGAKLDVPVLKRDWSVVGRYGMLEASAIGKEWHEQAEAVEGYLIETQKPDFDRYLDAEGHTDAISGASISVREFFELVKKALAVGPIVSPKYSDGMWIAESAEASESGWKDYVSIIVKGGKIVTAQWNAFNAEGQDKKSLVKEGAYTMSSLEGAKTWSEQAELAIKHLLATQDPKDISFIDAEGHVDAITGVSISVKEFFTLADKALEGAKL